MGDLIVGSLMEVFWLTLKVIAQIVKFFVVLAANLWQSR